MARRYKFNLGGIKNTLHYHAHHTWWIESIALVMAAIGTGGFFLVNSLETDHERITREAVESFSAASALPELDTYEIIDDAVISVTNTSMQTSYNFRENYVAIDGPDGADRILLFSEYPSETIDNVRVETCETYSSLFSALEQFQTVNGFQHPDFEDLTVSSIPFTQTYCP